MESTCRSWGSELRIKESLQVSPEEAYIAEYGDKGQAKRLVDAKRLNQSPVSSPTIPENGSPGRSPGRPNSIPPRRKDGNSGSRRSSANQKSEVRKKEPNQKNIFAK